MAGDAKPAELGAWGRVTRAPIRVAMLGCGTVGGEVVRLLREQAADSRPGWARPSSWSGWPCAARTGTPSAGGAAHHRRVGAGHAPRRGRRRRGDRRHRARAHVAAGGAEGGQVGRHGEQGAARRGRGRRCRRRRRRRAPTSTTRRRSRARSRCCGRCASRWRGDRITRVAGIVNGTTNFILSSMAASGAELRRRARRGDRLGYAEADPTADVDGFDAASKAAILASLAFHTRVTAADVHREGIPGVTAADIAARARHGLHGQTAGDLRAHGGRRRVGPARVHPAMIPRPTRSPASTALQRGLRRGRRRRPAHVLRPGRGRRADRSAVLGDLVAVARNRIAGGRGPRETAYADLPSGRWARCSPATTSASTSPTAPACWPRSRALRRRTA